MVTPETILNLALHGTTEECFTVMGRSRAVVIQRALALAHEPTVAVEHPLLVQELLGRVEAGRARRSAAGLA